MLLLLPLVLPLPLLPPLCSNCWAVRGLTWCSRLNATKQIALMAEQINTEVGACHAVSVKLLG